MYWNLSKGPDKEIFLWRSDNCVTLVPFAVQEALGIAYRAIRDQQGQVDCLMHLVCALFNSSFAAWGNFFHLFQIKFSFALFLCV